MEFTAWFEENKDELAKLLKHDAEEALFEAFLAGMAYGGGYIADVVNASGILD